MSGAAAGRATITIPPLHIHFRFFFRLGREERGRALWSVHIGSKDADSSDRIVGACIGARGLDEGACDSRGMCVRLRGSLPVAAARNFSVDTDPVGRHREH